MSDRKIIIPASMQNLAQRAGYAPAVVVGNTVYCAGQVGRTEDLQVIADPKAQFISCWENLRIVLEEAGCSFENIVEMTTYHVDMKKHMDIFRVVKDAIFPRGHCAWTCIGVSELAHSGLLVEIKCIAVKRSSTTN
ncbi:enamine deaminase RidA (YjgF/YER057c/UK114 family) [Providencia alcalifaciens]|nr:enamine deaminase RidA (YjgF/YER057c/UK114 family) [Providencia alcalifaciens]